MICKEVINPLFVQDDEKITYDITHKSVKIELVVANTWISIYTIESNNPGHGEVQEVIILLKEKYTDKEIWASTPLKPAIEHIFNKLNVKYI